jgi:hypothetical protein
MNKEMKRLETKKLSCQLLDDLKDEQRTRLELLYEEMTEAGASQKGIMHAIKHAYHKEITFAAHVPKGQYPTPQLHLR